jgi:hypothetical protein
VRRRDIPVTSEAKDSLEIWTTYRRTSIKHSHGNETTTVDCRASITWQRVEYLLPRFGQENAFRPIHTLCLSV